MPNFYFLKSSSNQWTTILKRKCSLNVLCNYIDLKWLWIYLHNKISFPVINVNFWLIFRKLNYYREYKYSLTIKILNRSIVILIYKKSICFSTFVRMPCVFLQFPFPLLFTQDEKKERKTNDHFLHKKLNN